MGLKIKNWHKFQHFKDRKPPWIKLYRDVLDDVDWHELDPLAAKCLVMLWLIASEDDGNLPSIRTLAFRLRLSESQAKSMILKLNHYLEQDDINLISERYQHDAPEIEKEIETDIETEAETETRARRASSIDPEFENRFWREWPNKVGKPAAVKAWAAARKRGHSVASIMIGLEIYISNKPPDRPWLNPSTFLNQERFLDQPARTTEKQSTMSKLFELSKEYENEQGSSGEGNFDNFGVIPFRK
jgi:hypothetical protein